MSFVPSPQVIIPYDYDLFIGLDVHKVNINLTTLDHAGNRQHLQIPAKPEVLLRYIQKHHADKRVALAYEAGPTGYGLYDQLATAGWPCLVTAPSNLPAEGKNKVKTNRIDSAKLATKLRGGELAGIRVPPPLYRELRHLAHQWNNLAKKVRGVKCQIKSLLLLEGIPFPADKATFTQETQARLALLPGPPAVQVVVQQHLQTLRFYHTEQLALKREILRLGGSEPELAEGLEYLMSLPGVSWRVASQVLARVGDWQQLQSQGEIAGLLGLGPRERSSGQKVRKGGITRAGDRQVRNMVIEAAWVAIRFDPVLAAFYQRLVGRHPTDGAKRKAIVAVARKLTERMYRVLKDRRRYESRTVPVETVAATQS
jgi:transposase